MSQTLGIRFCTVDYIYQCHVLQSSNPKTKSSITSNPILAQLFIMSDQISPQEIDISISSVELPLCEKKDI